jgi:simple sugar transport system permease protein
MALQGFTAGMGWNGLATALIAKNHPLWVIPAALLLAYMDMGAKTAMIYTDFSFELGSFIQAVILFLITASAVKFFKRRKSAEKPGVKIERGAGLDS